MGAVQQNGSVSPGHSAVWTTNGVIQDGGPFPAGPRVLGRQLGASFSTTTDQPILFPATVSALSITGIIVTNASVNLTTAAGGFYPQASKAGSAIVAATQIYVALTSPSVLISLPLTSAAQTTRYSAANLGTIGTQLAIYFALSTPQMGSATADIYVLGVDLSA